jgi:hypothetical protein
VPVRVRFVGAAGVSGGDEGTRRLELGLNVFNVDGVVLGIFQLFFGV